VHIWKFLTETNFINHNLRLETSDKYYSSLVGCDIDVWSLNMLPDPKDVAKVLKKTIFKSKAEKQREAEIERDLTLRRARTKITQYIDKQKSLQCQMRVLAKKALALSDEPHFRQAGKQLLLAEKEVKRWEKYLLTLELLQARQEQALASVELLNAVQASSESLMAVADPQQMASLQLELEKGLAKAASLDEKMQMMMELVDSAVDNNVVVDDDLRDLESSLYDEIAREEAERFDHAIDDDLERIRQELRDQ
jgi:hypothetical protein